MNKFAVDGHQMAYQDVGQGPVIVFGHSYLWDSEMWAPQIEVLSQNYRCVVPDFWAHGQSEFAPASTTSLVDYAQQIIALMDHLEVEQFSIIGLSVGGMWGSEVVNLAPERVKSLVMMDTFVGLEPEVTHKNTSLCWKLFRPHKWCQSLSLILLLRCFLREMQSKSHLI